MNHVQAHGDDKCPIYGDVVLLNEADKCSLCGYGVFQVLYRRMCTGCRQVRFMSIHRKLCKPCYNEWFRLYRLERSARASEVAA